MRTNYKKILEESKIRIFKGRTPKQIVQIINLTKK